MASSATSSAEKSLQRFILRANNHGRTGKHVHKLIEDLIPNYYDSGGILLSSKKFMALYRCDPLVAKLINDYQDELHCIWIHSVSLFRCLSNSFLSQYATLPDELEEDDNLEYALSRCFKESLLSPNFVLLQWEKKQILQKNGILADGLSYKYQRFLTTERDIYKLTTGSRQEELSDISYLHLFVIY
eukprot:Gb_22418 [translate_table: standard]